jgi:Mrp family chromosome partitioning ATPase
LCGPSVAYLLGIEGRDVHQCPEGWVIEWHIKIVEIYNNSLVLQVPVFTDQTQRLSVMSIAFLLKSRTDAVIWRGPKKTAMIRQFINDVFWNELDFLIIDTPPGTSDEHITVMECMKEIRCDGAVLGRIY